MEMLLHMNDTEPVRMGKDIPTGSERILAVDDEPIVLQTMATVLSCLGYQVDCAKSGEEAVEFVRQHDVDLILLDMIMPGINGAETFRRIKAIKPAQKAVVLSGYADPTVLAEARRLGISQYLMKPAPVAAIATAIRGALDPQRPPCPPVPERERRVSAAGRTGPLPRSQASTETRTESPA
jgi:CheY-like chemotaxis protein